MESLPHSAHENSSDWDDDDSDSGVLHSSKPAHRVAAPAPESSAWLTPKPEKQQSTSRQPEQNSFFTSEATKPATRESLINPELLHESSENEEDSDDDDNEITALSPDESKLVVHQYVTERATAVDAELEHATPASPSAAAATADKVLLDHIDAQATSETPAQLTTEEMLNQAILMTAQELGLAIDGLESIEAASDEVGELSADTQDSSGEPLAATEQSEADTEDDTATQSNTFSSPPTAAGSGSSSQGGTGNSGQAQASPHNPAGSPTPSPLPGAGTPQNPPGNGGVNGGNGGNGGGGNMPPQNPNALPPIGGPTPNVLPTVLANPANTAGNLIFTASAESQNQRERSNDFAKGMLVGGVAGYLLGRRHGRIKTEKRLTVVKEKLQSEVNNLQEAVLQKEQQVRRLAAEKAIQEHATSAELAAEQTHDTAPTQKTEQLISSVEQPTVIAPVEATPQAKDSKETVVTAAKTQEQHQKMPTPQAIERMPIHDVLLIAKDVTIEGSNLAELYKAGRIEEQALRRVLSEQSRTGHAEKLLRNELAMAKERAKTADRNQELRDVPQSSQSSRQTSGSSHNSQDQSIWSDSQAISANLGNLGQAPAWDVDQAIQKHAQQTLQQAAPKRNRKTTSAIGVAIAVLAAICVILLVIGR